MGRAKYVVELMRSLLRILMVTRARVLLKADADCGRPGGGHHGGRFASALFWSMP